MFMRIFIYALRPCRYIMLLQMQHIPLGGSAVAQRSGDKALEQGMCAVGAALIGRAHV